MTLQLGTLDISETGLCTVMLGVVGGRRRQKNIQQLV